MTWNEPQGDIGKQTWGTADQRLKAADVSHEQVQVAWVKQALAGQAQFGEFPAHAHRLENDLVTSLQVIKKQFPNLRLAFLSSRIYGGYATTALNPEPYAFETAFAPRWLIQDQIAGNELSRSGDLAPANVRLAHCSKARLNNREYPTTSHPRTHRSARRGGRCDDRGDRRRRDRASIAPGNRSALGYHDRGAHPPVSRP